MTGDKEPGQHQSRAPAVRDAAPDLLDLLIEQVVDYAIFVIDVEGRIATWNAGAQRIKGYAPQEIIGKPYALFFTEEDQKAGKPARVLGHVRAHGRFEEEGWRVRKDGERFWASVVITALHDAAGELKGFAKITRDLTEQRRAEEEARRGAAERAARQQAERDEREVRRSRDQLDLILRNIAEGVSAQRADGALVYANDAAAELCGFATAEEMLKATAAEVLDRFEIAREDGTPFPPAELPGRRALEGVSSKAIVRFRVKRTGDERWAFVSGSPVFYGDDSVLAVSVFRDFTDRRRAEERWQFLSGVSAALGSSLDFAATLSQVIDLAVPGIADWCGVDILDANDRLEQLAVAHVDPAKRELAKEWRRRWPPRPDGLSYRVVRSGAPELVREITDAMIDAGVPDPAERQLVRALGLRSVMAVPLIVGRKPFGVVSFATAESGRRYGPQDLILATEIGRRASLAVENARAYEEARTAVQTRDNFLAIASHELRTPLSGLTMLLTSLVRMAGEGRLERLGPEALRDRLNKAERQGRQLARLVDRLLDISRLTSRDIRLDRDQTDLAEVVRDVLSRFEDTIAECGSSIEVTLDGPVVGLWDRSRLDQVVTNLVGNALKYGAGAPISISVAAGWSGQARLTVRDEGPGIASEDQERIFTQYERAASEHAGMGLGLWLVRRIVTAHGGTVTVNSNPGQGATFLVILPLGLEPKTADGK
jgi:PAS domain S-box-containing protein